MERGKEICKMLKEIRRQIARENDIVFFTTECKHKGHCAGTCPKCEAEVAYLEEQLAARKRLGKTNRIAGVAMGIAATIPAVFASCNHVQGDVNPPLEGDPVVPVDTVQQAKQQAGKKGEQSELEDLEGMVLPSASDENDDPLVVGMIDELLADTDSIAFDVCEEMPEMPGGAAALKRYLRKHIQYPQEEREAGKEGRVVVEFIVEKDGSINNAKVLRSVDPLFDAEALRVINAMPKWHPGKIRGQVVRTRFRTAVDFILD